MGLSKRELTNMGLPIERENVKRWGLSTREPTNMVLQKGKM